MLACNHQLYSFHRVCVQTSQNARQHSADMPHSQTYTRSVVQTSRSYTRIGILIARNAAGQAKTRRLDAAPPPARRMSAAASPCCCRALAAQQAPPLARRLFRAINNSSRIKSSNSSSRSTTAAGRPLLRSRTARAASTPAALRTRRAVAAAAAAAAAGMATPAGAASGAQAEARDHSSQANTDAIREVARRYELDVDFKRRLLEGYARVRCGCDVMCVCVWMLMCVCVSVCAAVHCAVWEMVCVRAVGRGCGEVWGDPTASARTPTPPKSTPPPTTTDHARGGARRRPRGRPRHARPRGHPLRAAHQLARGAR